MKWSTFSGLVVASGAALFLARKVLLPPRRTPEQVLEDVAREARRSGFREREGLRELDRALGDAELMKDDELAVRILDLHARILIELGAYPEAQADLTRVLRRYVPNDPDYECLLAEISHLSGDEDRALQVVRGILRRNPEHGQAWRQRGLYEERLATLALEEACQTTRETLLTTEAARGVGLLEQIAARDHSDPERVALAAELRELFLPRFERPLAVVLEKVDLASLSYSNARFSWSRSFTDRFDSEAVEGFMRLTKAAGRTELAADFGIAALAHPSLEQDPVLLATLFDVLESVGRNEQLARLLGSIEWTEVDGDLDFFVNASRILYLGEQWKPLSFAVPRMARLGGAVESSYSSFYQGMTMVGLNRPDLAIRRLEPYLRGRLGHEPIPGALGIAGVALADLYAEQGNSKERWALERAVLFAPEDHPEAYLRLVELQLEDDNVTYGVPEDRWTRAMSLLPERTDELRPFWEELGRQALTARGRDLDSIMRRLRDTGASVPAAEVGAWTLFRIGELHLADDHSLGAIKIAKELRMRYPGLLPALDLAIEAHLDRSQYQSAADLVLERLRAVGRDGKTTEYLSALGEDPFGDQQMLEMMLADPERTGRLILARFLLDDGEAERALRALEATASSAPIPEARLTHAEALFELGRYEEAAEILAPITDDERFGAQAAARRLLALFHSRDREALSTALETDLPSASGDAAGVLALADAALNGGRARIVDTVLEYLDSQTETRSGEALWRMALSAALQEDIVAAREALERAQAYLPDGRVELARIIFAVDSRDWTALPELVAELRATQFEPSPLTNTILTVLEERLDAASAMAESGLSQHPHSPEWALVIAADRLLDGRAFELPEYLGEGIEDATTRLLRGHGEIARDPREMLAFLLAEELPGWAIWRYQRILAKQDELVVEPWNTFLRSRALLDLGQTDAAEKGLEFLTMRERRFGPGWDVYEALRREQHPGEPWSPELVELRQVRLQSLGPEVAGTPLEVEVDRAATQVELGRFAAARAMLRGALDEAGPDAVHGRDLLARCHAELGDLAAASSEYLRACEALPVGTDHPLVAEFVSFLEAPRRAKRELAEEEIDFALERLHQRFPHDPLVSLAQARRLMAGDDGPELVIGFATNRLRALKKQARSESLDSLRPGTVLAWASFLLKLSPEQAEALVREELVAEPGNLELWLALAECVNAHGRSDAALELYQQLVDMSGDDRAHLALAWMLADSGASTQEIEPHLAASVLPGRRPSAKTRFIQLRSDLQSPDESLGDALVGLQGLWARRDEIRDEVPLGDLGMTYAGALILRCTRADERKLYEVVDELTEAAADTYERDTLRALESLAGIVAKERAKLAQRARAKAAQRRATKAAEEGAQGGAGKAPGKPADGSGE